MMIKYIKIDDLRLHLKNLVLDGERLDPKTTRLIIMTLRELPIHEVEEESMKEGVEKTQFVDANKKGDCISRQQVMDEIKRWRGYLDEDMIERINTRMNMLPPVTPAVRINLNEIVKFKLSERGKEVYRHRYDEYGFEYDREPKLDDDGYMSMQLWTFMQTFGEHMAMGMPEVVQPLEIIYEESEGE